MFHFCVIRFSQTDDSSGATKENGRDVQMATLLIVDDDDQVRSALYSIFAEDHDCHTAESVEQALVYLTVETYDVVLTDFLMPGLDGLELLGHIRQTQPETPVILISGLSEQDRAQKLIEMGAFEYLAKPFDLAKVEAVVARAIEHHQRLLQSHQSPKDQQP